MPKMGPVSRGAGRDACFAARGGGEGSSNCMMGSSGALALWRPDDMTIDGVDGVPSLRMRPLIGRGGKLKSNDCIRGEPDTRWIDTAVAVLARTSRSADTGLISSRYGAGEVGAVV